MPLAEHTVSVLGQIRYTSEVPPQPDSSHVSPMAAHCAAQVAYCAEFKQSPNDGWHLPATQSLRSPMRHW
jgi:hypothetical protein